MIESGLLAKEEQLIWVTNPICLNEISPCAAFWPVGTFALRDFPPPALPIASLNHVFSTVDFWPLMKSA